jgi:cytochrome P450
MLNLYGPEFQANHHEALRAVREQSWCANTPIGVAVLRHQEVQALLNHRQFRTPAADLLAMQGFGQGMMADAMRSFLLNTEGANHDRVRRLVTRAFTTSSVDAFRPRMRAIVYELLDAQAGRDEIDFMADFANRYAWQILCEFVGIPAGALMKIQKWNADIGLMFGLSVAEHAPNIEAALTGLYAFVDELAAQLRQSPGNDLLSALVNADSSDLLTGDELHAMAITLMSAGSGTVTNQLGNAIVTLSQHPEQWQRLAAEPALVPQAVEELIRFNPSVILGVPRVASDDLSWNGLEIQRGAFFLPIVGSANRDALVFERADSFDITRKAERGQPGHLAFGGGIHHCLGAVLARAELQEALPILAERFSQLELAGPGEWLPPTEAVYGPIRLPLKVAG